MKNLLILITVFLLPCLNSFGQNNPRNRYPVEKKHTRPSVNQPPRTSSSRIEYHHPKTSTPSTTTRKEKTNSIPGNYSSPTYTTTNTYTNRQNNIQVPTNPNNNVRPIHNHKGTTISANYRHIYPTRRVVRTTTYKALPRPINYHTRHYSYRRPLDVRVTWTYNMHKEYKYIYPEINHWHYRPGETIYTVSSYDAYDHIGEVRRVYGKVDEIFYARETDEYYIYLGYMYPYHDFSVIIPGHVARKFSRRPMLYFANQFISVTGLITIYNEIPEIMTRRPHQIEIY